MKNNTCKNCKWQIDCVCVNDDSGKCADLVWMDMSCPFWEEKENE